MRIPQPIQAAITLLFLSISTAMAQQPSIRVWAIGDNVRVHPITNRAREHNPFLIPDGLEQGYRKSNLVWNGADKLLSLKAARNEIIAFQLVIERIGEAPLTNINVKVGEFTGPGGGRIPGSNIDLYKEWYVKLRKRSAQDFSLGTGWYPDALLPCSKWSGNLYPHDFVLPFDIPDRMNNIGDTQRSHAMWVDVYVPRERDRVPPGIYESNITVSSDSGTASLKVQIQVWDFALPEENHLNGGFHSDTEINILNDDLELKYYQMIRRHRLTIGVLGYAPKVEVSGTDIHFDWTEYDRRLGKYLDGSAYTAEHGYHGPGYGLPLEHLVLPFDYEPMNEYKTSRLIQLSGKEFKFYRGWPISVPKEGPTQQYEEVYKKALRAYQKHFDDNPEWRKTRLILFFLSLDEAYDDPSYEKMLYYAKLVKDSGADRLEFRIDGGYETEVMKYLSQYIDIVAFGGEIDTEGLPELRELGLEDWFYSGPGNMDWDPLGNRAMSWFCFKHGLSSWLLWEFDFNALRAWLFPETYTTLDYRIYNGHGMYIYRGETMGLTEPVASIRLKILRRGAQDYEYFWLLSEQEGGKQKAQELVESIMVEPAGQEGQFGYWKRNAEEWDRVRIEAGELIESMTVDD